MIIGIAGRKRVGKNFVAEVIAGILKRYQDVKLVAFADPIKRYCHEVLGIDKVYLWGDGDKNTPTKYSWGSLPTACRPVDDLGFRRVAYPGFSGFDPHGSLIGACKSGLMTVREIMQVVGTELGRNIWGKDIWINAMYHQIEHVDSVADSWIITDVRMINEAQAVHKWGGIMIRVDGAPRGGDGFVDHHETETKVDSLEVDAIIDNGPGMTREGIEAQARKILKWE